MNIEASKRLKDLNDYPFDLINKQVDSLKAQGVDVIDFGAGDPTEPTPRLIRKAIKKAIDRHAESGYPSYIGGMDYREAIACWTKRRFGVSLKPETQICASIGSKEAIFNFHEAFVNPGDVVLVPNPAYPPYIRGTLFAEGQVHYMNLLPQNGFLPDLESIPSEILKRAKIMWLNNPINPTGTVMPLSFLKKALELCHNNEIILASDEAYSENYYDEAPHSLLEISDEGAVVFQSLSKRSCMTGYRVGWVAGDQKIVDQFKKLKTNIDSGTPTFIQDAASIALSDETHVNELRELYRKKRDILVDALVGAGLPECRPAATLYIWQKIPSGLTSVEFAKRLLDPKLALVTTPGSFVSSDTLGGNPGEGFVRFALVPTVKQCKMAAQRLSDHLII